MKRACRCPALKSFAVVGVLVGAVSCGELGDGPPLQRNKTESPVVAGGEKLDVLLKVVLSKGVTPANMKKAMPKGLVALRQGKVGGQAQVLADVLIEADPAAVSKLAQIGVTVRTVTSDGILTATAPLNKIEAIAALAEVTRVEAARPMKVLNTISNGLDLTNPNATIGMNNPRTGEGEGVIVGVIDTGLDWTHGDFIDDATGKSRILAYWDQSDTADDKVPAGFTYGHEYGQSDFDAYLSGNTAAVQESAKDTDGHGTHVAGTAAGDGSASGQRGVADKAQIIFVKFDFDGDRNSDAAIIDGVNYIFKKAAALGKPAVINMSLGMDYGPHDGTTLEERGIDALVGPGKIVVVAAGNPGANNWSPKLPYGYALHGKGDLMSSPTMTFLISPHTTVAGDEYFFFDVWYPKGTACRVQVTSPSGNKYPPNFAGSYRNTFVTNSGMSGLNTAEGAVIVGAGGDPIGVQSTTADQEMYIEVSDYWGKAPKQGLWTINLLPKDSKSVCKGVYHAWYGTSSTLIGAWQADSGRQAPKVGNAETDNAYTIGAPASANKVLAVAAYQSRNSWPYVYGPGPDELNPVCLAEPRMQSYGEFPIDRGDPYGLGELASYSARGPRRDNVLKPEIAAPGVGIASAFSHTVRDAENKCTSYWSGGDYHYGTNRVMPGEEAIVIQGTSMACPNATGAVALFLQKKRDLDVAQLRKLFESTRRVDSTVLTYENRANSAATDTDARGGAPNYDWGYGKLDIANSIGGLPDCSTGCFYGAACPAGQTCQASTSLAGCSSCVATPTCKPRGAACTTSSECCASYTCNARTRTCK